MNELITVAAWVAAVVLVLAGAAKLRRPSATAATLRAASLPSHPAAVRVLGLVEVVLGGTLLAFGGRLAAALIALSYVGFAVFAARHRQRPGASCGCFGESSGPLGRRHVVVDALVAAALLAAVVRPVGPATVLFTGPVLAGVLATATVAVAAWLLRLHLTDAVALDRVTAQIRGGTS